MPTIAACILCGAGALFIWGAIGFALGRRIVPGALALPLAPFIGAGVNVMDAILSFGSREWEVGSKEAIPKSLLPTSISATLSQVWACA